MGRREMNTDYDSFQRWVVRVAGKQWGVGYAISSPEVRPVEKIDWASFTMNQARTKKPAGSMVLPSDLNHNDLIPDLERGEIFVLEKLHDGPIMDKLTRVLRTGECKPVSPFLCMELIKTYEEKEKKEKGCGEAWLESIPGRFLEMLKAEWRLCVPAVISDSFGRWQVIGLEWNNNRLCLNRWLINDGGINIEFQMLARLV